MFLTSLSTSLRKRVGPRALQRTESSRTLGHLERSILVWLNVINALLLRDIRTRAGKFYIGYVVIFSMPFVHLASLLIAFVVILNRLPPFGNQPALFFGLSTLPFVIFVYPSRQVMLSLLANRPLLYFPRVKIVDVFIARGLLEFANGMAVSAVVCIVLFLMQGEFSPRDSLSFVSALILTLYLGFAWGAYNSLIAQIFHFWPMAFNLCFPLLWMASGIMFNAHGLPMFYGHLLSFNPLFECMEFLRYAYFEDYPTDLLDVGYVFWFATCLLAAALVFERTFRRQILTG